MRLLTALILTPSIYLSSWGQTECVTKETIYQSDTLTIYTVSEVMPSVKGGTGKFISWNEKNLRKSLRTKKNQDKIKVHVYFIINENGQLTNFRILQGHGEPYDSEALRLMRSNPIEWFPAKCKGKAVKTEMVMSINF